MTPFDCNIKFHMLDATEMFFKLQDSIINVVDYINTNGGFTVIGWYKKGSINDISTEEGGNQVESSEMGYHVVSITPTNKSILEKDEYKNKRFSIDNINE